jgi:hypothetical protein
VTSKRWRSVVVTLLLLASLAEFTVRGPVRMWQGMGWNDFLSPYIQAKAWAHGEDPYSTRSLISFWPADNKRPVWVDKDLANGALEAKRGIPSPYPLSSLVVISPITIFPWRVAVILWMAITFAAVVLAPFALLSICGLGATEARAQLFLAFAFALAPLHTGLATANPALVVVSLMVASVWAEHRGKNNLAGLLLAIAACLKPTVAGGLLLFYLVRRQWRVVGIACAAVAIISGLGMAWLTWAGVSWLPSYFENTRKMFSPGSLDDFARADAIRFNMINAQVLFYSVLRNATLADRLARLLSAALLLTWGWFCSRRGRASDLLAISAISVVSLIAVYHRFYDAALLIWPLAWGLLAVKNRRIQIATLAMIAPFLVPGPAVLGRLGAAGWIPSGFTGSWWWNAWVMPHEVLALLLLAGVLLYWLARETSEQVAPDVSGDGTAVRPGSALSGT